jgi:hypothetical protein
VPPASPAPPDPGGRPRRGWTRGDLPVVERLDITAADWADPARTLARLRDWAERRAVVTIDWYTRDKAAKRWFSRLLRAAAVVAAVAGGVLPLISGTVDGVNPSLGYVFLATAAGLVAFDHFFGLSSGWMRDIAAIEALQGTLVRFQLDWTRWQAEQAGALPAAPRTPAEATSAALDLISALVTAIAEVTEAETAQWITDFSTSVAALRQQASPAVTSPQDLLTWGEQGNLSAG